MFLLESVLPFLGILVGLVILHELGHFTVAKLAGVRIEEFGIGLPPRIWGKRRGDTLYSINWLPIGGFVRLTGEESARISVDRVNPHSASDRAGLRRSDIIVAVNGKAVHSEQQLAERLQGLRGAAIGLTVEREYRTEGGIERRRFDAQLESAAGEPSETAPPDESAAAGIGRIAGLQVKGDPRSLGSKPRPVRIAVLAAGAGVNAILPIGLFAIAAMIPQPVPQGPVVVTSVYANSPAEEAGLLPGDRFVDINGEPVRNINEVGRAIQLHLGGTVTAVVERDAENFSGSFAGMRETELIELELHARLAPQPLEHVVQPGETTAGIASRLGVTQRQVLDGAGIERTIPLDPGILLELPDGTVYETQEDDSVLSVARMFGLRQQTILEAAGIDLQHLDPGTLVRIPQGPTGITIANASTATVNESEGLFSAFQSGWNETIDTLVLLRNRIRSWIAGGEGVQLSGPIGIAQVTGEVVEQAGWLRLIELAALLSLNLAIINILPLPMLDGGRIVFVLLEVVRRGKRVSPEKEGLVHLAGFVLLITFVIVVSYFDIVRVVSGEGVLR